MARPWLRGLRFPRLVDFWSLLAAQQAVESTVESVTDKPDCVHYQEDPAVVVDRNERVSVSCFAERVQTAMKKAGAVAEPIVFPDAKHGIEDNWGPGGRQPGTFPPNAEHPKFLENALRSGKQRELSWQPKLAEHVSPWEPARFG